MEVYRCPEDNYLSPVQKKAGWKFRLWSVKMNWHVGGGRWSNEAKEIEGLKVFRKMSEFGNPSGIFVIIDIHPDTLGFPPYTLATHDVLIKHLEKGAWGNLPSSLHSGGATMVMSDGRAFRKEWKDPSTMPPVKFQEYLNFKVPLVPAGPGSDLEWMARHMTEYKPGWN